MSANQPISQNELLGFQKETMNYLHAFYATVDGVGCTLSGTNSPNPAPIETSFTCPFPFDPAGREVTFQHIGSWDHKPSEDELNAAKIAHGFTIEDFYVVTLNEHLCPQCETSDLIPSLNFDGEDECPLCHYLTKRTVADA